MTRTVLTDGTNRWFDKSRAEKFEEDTYWNGNNMISKVTGSQWDHQNLYRTAGKKWILASFSQWQGSTDTYEELSDQEAAEWLVRNGHEHPDVEQEIASLEIQ